MVRKTGACVSPVTMEFIADQYMCALSKQRCEVIQLRLICDDLIVTFLVEFISVQVLREISVSA